MATRLLLRALGPLFALAPGFTQQTPPQVVVVAGPGEPGQLLRENLLAADFLFYDIALLVGEELRGLHRVWDRVETARLFALTRLLEHFLAESPGAKDPATVRNRSIANVARALLLHDSDVARHLLTADEQAEFDPVLAGTAGSLRFVPGNPSMDWSRSRPAGANALRPVLFRATIYLRTCLDAMPADQRSAWDTQMNAENGTSLDRAREVDAAFASLFGPLEKTWGPGLGGASTRPDRELLRDLRSLDGSPWKKLQSALGLPPPATPPSLCSAWLEVLHELATESPDDAMLQPLGLPWWRTKWLDCAQWGYVGLREIDALSDVGGVPDAPARPRLLVEPLPRTLRALERYDALRREFPALAGDDRDRKPPALPPGNPLLDVLEAQQKGQDPPATAIEQLLATLTPDPEDRPAAHPPVALDGIDGRLRRSGTYLLRVPIRWRGEAKTALVLHHFVENEVAGRWQPPPWGPALQADRLPGPAKK